MEAVVQYRYTRNLQKSSNKNLFKLPIGRSL